ncbi:MAG: hypothetical protein V8T10_07350 [Merdibacter sp.]
MKIRLKITSNPHMEALRMLGTFMSPLHCSRCAQQAHLQKGSAHT